MNDKRRPLFEHGVIHNVDVRWAKVGPFLAEWYGGWRCKFGVACGPWYAGVLLGPLIVTFGKRQFLPTRGAMADRLGEARRAPDRSGEGRPVNILIAVFCLSVIAALILCIWTDTTDVMERAEHEELLDELWGDE